MHDFKPVNVSLGMTSLNNEIVTRVVKSTNIHEFDENTYAKKMNLTFHNGIIEVKMLSRLLPDAPSFARGFIGIAFRINEDDSEFESFYVRPTNGRVTENVRKNRAIQYFSYPKYKFDYFRKNGISDYEGTADIGLDEWITLKAVINCSNGTFYLNDNETPALVVKNMKHGDSKGSLGLFVDIGTEGFFKELKTTLFD
ncbi:hypothetical protein Corgl_0934 [Coriobacterium glomerans PW2]|uniref:3-keto-disaccharide hydrolase domain-containing protein n=2 Tax=Coriobacterium TaxID=33870 RepID=F2N9L5_CORGP|nr:hypothetical protein Corgl_0934 [Coriobacterium glomerans PW2]